MNKFVLLLTLVSFFSCYPIENCLLYKENGDCHECALGYIAAENKKQCNPCIDLGCEMCSTNFFYSCTKCKEGYFYYDKQCGVGCALVENCNICSADLSECLKCNKGCSVIDGECSCALRNVLIIYSVIIIVLIIIVVIVWWRRRKVVKIIEEMAAKYKTKEKNDFNNVNNENPSENDKDKNNTQRPKISMHINSDNDRGQKTQTNTSLLDEVDEKVDKIKVEHKLATVDDKTNTMSSMGKKLCDYCLIEPGVARLQCGCYLCERHRNYNEFTNTPNTCPVCKAKLI